MKYILDFDRTLFDTDALVQAFVEAGTDWSALKPELLTGYQQQDFLYQDTLDFLQTKPKRDLTILTALSAGFGDEVGAYQKAKVEQGPIASLVQDVVYVEQDKGSAAAIIAGGWPADAPVVFIDDVLEHCLSVLQALPHARCFLMQRSPADTTTRKDVPGVIVVDSLTAVDVYLQSVYKSLAGD